MPITIEATYENGMLKLEHPLPLQEHQRVRLTIHTETSGLLRAYGICGWKGSVEDADRFATDPELDFPPPPEEP